MHVLPSGRRPYISSFWVWPGPGAALSRGTQRRDDWGLWAQERVSPGLLSSLSLGLSSHAAVKCLSQAGFPWRRMKASGALLSSHVTAGGRLRRGPTEWVSPASSVAHRGDRSCPWSRPSLQNHKQINSYCKLLNLGAVCYTAFGS